jgi:hypothetical protein
VNSFTANVDSAGALESHWRTADVTALVNCESGQAHIGLTLEQSNASSKGSVVADCRNQLARVPVTVHAMGKNGFEAGLATAHVEALVMDHGDVTQDQHWTKLVTLSPAQ